MSILYFNNGEYEPKIGDRVVIRNSIKTGVIKEISQSGCNVAIKVKFMDNGVKTYKPKELNLINLDLAKKQNKDIKI